MLINCIQNCQAEEIKKSGFLSALHPVFNEIPDSPGLRRFGNCLGPVFSNDTGMLPDADDLG